MTGIIFTVEHGATAVSGGVIVWFGTLIRDWVRKRKPIEDSAHVITESFSALTDKLEHRIEVADRQIESLREENHALRGELHKLKHFANAVFMHVAKLESQVMGAGLVPVARPVLPVLE